MGFMKSMEEANYNFDAKNEGWIYNWTEKFMTENINIMTPEIIEVTLTNMPPIEIYTSTTSQIKSQKGQVEQALQQIKMEINNQKGRSI